MWREGEKSKTREQQQQRQKWGFYLLVHEYLSQKVLFFFHYNSAFWWKNETKKKTFNPVNVYGSPIAIKASVTEANKPFSSLIKYCKESQDNNLKHKQNSILSYYYHNFFKLIICFIVCLVTKIIKGSYTFKRFTTPRNQSHIWRTTTQLHSFISTN